MRCNGQRIKALRIVNGLTLKEVALALGVQEATIQRYESGKIKDIPNDRVYELAKILGTTVEHITGIGDVIENTPDRGVEWWLSPTKKAGENIRNRRIQLRLTVEELAQRVQVSRQTIYRYESGKLGKLSVKTKRRLADELHTSVAYILGKTTDPFDDSRAVQMLDELVDAQIIKLDKENSLYEPLSQAALYHMKVVLGICSNAGLPSDKIHEGINFVTAFIQLNEEFLKNSIYVTHNDNSDE